MKYTTETNEINDIKMLIEMLRLKHLSVIITSQICLLADLLNRLDSVRVKKEC